MGLAHHFSFPEVFALYSLGIAPLISLTGDNVVNGLMAAAVGIALGLVGLDPINMVTWLDMGLRSDFEELALVIGLLAIGELFRLARQVFSWNDGEGSLPLLPRGAHGGARDVLRLGGRHFRRRDPRGRCHASGNDRLSDGADVIQEPQGVRSRLDQGPRREGGGAERLERRGADPR